MRLLLVCCSLFVLQEAAARKPLCFDVPYTLEKGKYVVMLETPVGPRRFFFDTGATRSCISERLCGELGLTPDHQIPVYDFEGHRQQLAMVQLPWLKLGEAEFRDRQVLVLPDSAYLISCYGIDGLAGSDLLQKYAVRMPNADSTITLASHVRLLGKMERRHSMRMHMVAGSPMVVPRLKNGEKNYTVWMAFDTGSAGLVDCRYDECQALIRNGIARDVRRTEGHSGNLGWTNRSVVNEAVRFVVPTCELAGSSLSELPFEVTHGRTSKLGCGVFRWGVVVVDYPGRRFWLLPHARQPEPPDTSVCNVIFSLDGGRLVIGQVWDESLADIVAPGDRIVRIGTLDVEHLDICAFLRGEVSGDKPEITVERKDGTRVTVPVRRIE